MMPLIFAEKGEPQIIKKIGGSPEVKKHLQDLGFNVGGDVNPRKDRQPYRLDIHPAWLGQLAGSHQRHQA